MSYSSTKTSYRPDIDGLRALAVGLVILYHAFPASFRGGFIGVDIFFVISGFLIGGIILRELREGTFSFFDFYSRRILRIFPALAVVLSAVLVAGYFLLFSDELRALGKHVSGGVTFIANILYWFEAGYWDVSAKLKPLLHLWSLGVEEQFYIVVPILLIVAWKRKYRLLTFVVILLLASFIFNLHYYKRNPTLAFYAPFTRFWEIMAGVVLAACHEYGDAIKRIGQKIDSSLAKVFWVTPMEHDGRTLRNFSAMLGFGLLVAAVLVCRVDKLFPGYRALLPTLGTIFIIAAGPHAWLNAKIFANKFAVGIGLISYPLYLWHWPLLSYTTILGGEFLGPWQWRIFRFALVLLSFFLAFLTYILIERPIRFGKGSKRAKTFALIILVSCIGIVGFSVFHADGLPERVLLKPYQKKIEGLAHGPERDDAGIRYAHEAKTLRYLRYLDAGSDRTVAVMGDSHAWAAFPGIAERNKELGLNTVLLTYGPDSSLPDRASALAVLKSRKEITDIFVFLRGILYLTEHDLDRRFNRPGSLKEKYRPFLQEVIDELRNTGKRVYIIGENPVFSYQPRDFIPRPFELALKRKVAPPVIKKEDVYRHQKEYLAMLGNLHGAEIINGIDIFCPDGICSMFSKDGIPLYFDDDHLSIMGSRYLVKNLLEPFLAAIAARTPG